MSSNSGRASSGTNQNANNTATHGNSHGRGQLTANHLHQILPARQDEVGMGKYLKSNPTQDPYYASAAIQHRTHHNEELQRQLANVDALFPNGQ